MSEKMAFRMQLNEGQAEEYKRRHDDIWPELVEIQRGYRVVADNQAIITAHVLSKVEAAIQ